MKYAILVLCFLLAGCPQPTAVPDDAETVIWDPSRIDEVDDAEPDEAEDDDEGESGSAPIGQAPPAEFTLIRSGVIAFGFEGCQYCIPFKRDVAPWLIAAGWSDQNLQFVDTVKHPDIAEKFGVEDVPVYVLMDGGKEVKRITGSLDRDTFTAWYEGRTAKAAGLGYEPVGDEPFIERHSGRTSFYHLVNDHGLNPQILRNTPKHLFNLIHGDCHRGRTPRTIQLQLTQQTWDRRRRSST